MKINRNFLGGEGEKIQKTFYEGGGVWIFSGTAHWYSCRVKEAFHIIVYSVFCPQSYT